MVPKQVVYNIKFYDRNDMGRTIKLNYDRKALASVVNNNRKT